MSRLAALPATTVALVRRAGVVGPSLALGSALGSSALAGASIYEGTHATTQGAAAAGFAACGVLALATPIVLHGLAASGFALALERRPTVRDVLALALDRSFGIAFTLFGQAFALALLAAGVKFLLAVAETSPVLALAGLPLVVAACWVQGCSVALSTTVTLLEVQAGSIAHARRLLALARGDPLLVLAAGAVPLGILVSVSVGAQGPTLAIVPPALSGWMRWLAPIAAFPLVTLVDAALGAAVYAILTGRSEP